MKLNSLWSWHISSVLWLTKRAGQVHCFSVLLFLKWINHMDWCTWSTHLVNQPTINILQCIATESRYSVSAHTLLQIKTIFIRMYVHTYATWSYNHLNGFVFIHGMCTNMCECIVQFSGSCGMSKLINQWVVKYKGAWKSGRAIIIIYSPHINIKNYVLFSTSAVTPASFVSLV